MFRILDLETFEYDPIEEIEIKEIYQSKKAIDDEEDQ